MHDHASVFGASCMVMHPFWRRSAALRAPLLPIPHHSHSLDFHTFIASERDPSTLPVQSPWYTDLSDDSRDVFLFQLDVWGNFTGWIKGPRGELLLWIPPEYRKCLYGPRNTLVIGTGAVSLDMRHYVHGTDWTKCYTPRNGSIRL
ncbi:hypothetical protein CERSUDRAFT_124014 [Gelatoporia subvermispora B]|uniref:Uncharacterized protein n=1 Tax=Ceriporiopsis subvermispora (strain B) TaxID=914234 RepID=M2RF00_CERS8|nr:hypothetical protein CERSUDRAFT_124014 [Gelatoporia subvermispora B]